MRYPPEHKIQARARLIEAGGALAKKEGFGNTGMDALTAAAGVTTGAFYSQFRSKTEFLQAIIEHELARTIDAFQGKSKEGLERALSRYMSQPHVADPEQGCPIPALGAEVARADLATRERFETLLLELMSTLQSQVDNPAAWAILTQAVGGVILARAVANPETSAQILDGALTNARKLLQQGHI